MTNLRTLVWLIGLSALSSQLSTPLRSQPSAPSTTTLVVDKTTGEIKGPVDADTFRTNNNLGGSGSGSGDVSSNTSTSVANEIVLFANTGGKVIKRATTTGILKGTSGVLSTATAGTDYLAPDAIGDTIQAYSAKLAALAQLTWAADKVAYFTDSTTVTLTDFTAFGRSLAAAADAAAARTALELSSNTVTSITGTANQVTASASTGAVTLSLPSSITGVNTLNPSAAFALNAASDTDATLTFVETTGTGSRLFETTMNSTQMGVENRISVFGSNANSYGRFSGNRGRGTRSSPSDVENGDTMFAFISRAYSGGTLFSTAEMDFVVDGTFTTGQRPPSRMEFYTNAANGAQTKRLQINSDGILQSAASSTLTFRGGDSGGATVAIGSGSSGNVTITPGASGGIGLSGKTGIGTAFNDNILLTLGDVALSSGTGVFGAYGAMTVPSGATGISVQYFGNMRTAAASFTAGTVSNFRASSAIVGSGSAITALEGFTVTSTMTQGASNYGFRGQLPASGTSRWNAYMDGTAPNYFGGEVYIGSSTDLGDYALQVTGNNIVTGTITAGSAPTTLTDSTGKILSAGLNTVGVAQGGTGITSGNSGGVPYFSGSTTIASSAALASGNIVLGGGAGSAPATTATGTGVVTALGINTGSAGAFQVNNASGAGLTSLTAANITAGALADGMTATTQSARDNSAKLATTAYVDRPPGNVIVTGNTTLSSTHRGIWTYVNSVSPVTLTVDTSSSSGEDIFYIRQMGAGQVTLTGSGFTISTPANATVTTRAQNSSIFLQSTSTSAGFVGGDLTP